MLLVILIIIVIIIVAAITVVVGVASLPSHHLSRACLQVRLLAANASVQFARLLTRDEAVAEVLPALHAASKDRSWRVRAVIAEKWSELQACFGPELTRSDLTPMLSRLLQV